MGTVISVLVTRYILQIQQQIKHMSFQTIMVSRVDFKGGGFTTEKVSPFPIGTGPEVFFTWKRQEAGCCLGESPVLKLTFFFFNVFFLLVC